MKTTIKLAGAKSLTVEPCTKRGGILATFAFEMFGIKSSESIHLTSDQCGALIFGLESAIPMKDQHHAARAAFEASAG
jgi:hypothetical protein